MNSFTKRAAWCAALLGVSLAACAAFDPSINFAAPEKRTSKKTVKARQIPNAPSPVSGGIGQRALEIEEGVSGNATKIGANLYPRQLGDNDPILSVPQFPNDALATFLGFFAPALANTPLLNAETVPYIDWVKDTLVNNDPASVTGNVATGIINGVSGALYNGQKRGHWNGARIVDTIANAETDIFVKGGKEDDTSTWQIDAGSVGSSKYDATQAFIANASFPTSDTTNFPTGVKNVLYFGMERRGNNGTTAFDFEFNQKPPLTDYVPNRSDGDVLFTFEMNGSATSGSAVPHVYVYKNGNYLSNEILANSLPAPRRPVASINQAETPSAPWGYVDSKGVWTIGKVPVFSVAESAVPFGVDFLKDINGCGGSAYVQIRTRSSVTNTSDLKDTTKYFKYTFGGPDADLQLQSECGQKFSYSGSGSKDSQGGTSLTYKWKFHTPANVTLSSSDPELGADSDFPGDATRYAANFTSDTVRTINVGLPVGVDSANIDVQLTVQESGTCTDSTSTYTVKVYRTLDVTPTLSATCDTDVLTYGSTVSGGKSPYSYSWKFYRKGTPDVQVGTSTTASGTVSVGSKGDYYATLEVKDTADTSSDSHVIAKPQCSIQKQTGDVTVYDPINPVATKDSANGTNMTVTLKVTFNAPGDVQWQKFVGGAWSDITGANSATYTYSSFEADDTSPAASTFSIGTDSYTGKVYSVKFRAKITRSVNGGCNATSNEVTVKKVIAVDP